MPTAPTKTEKAKRHRKAERGKTSKIKKTAFARDIN